jgi:hypothetical protein
VDKNGENPGAENSSVHFVRYILDDVDRAAFPKVSGVTIVNQFGEFVLDVRAPDQLLVPTAKSVVPDDPPNPLPDNAADHYLCHRVHVQKQPDLKNIALTLIDQFSAPDSYGMKLKRMDRLCASVSKNDGPVVDERTHLLCFETASIDEDFDKLDVNLVNQCFDFEPQEVQITREQEFCVEFK